MKDSIKSTAWCNQIRWMLVAIISILIRWIQFRETIWTWINSETLIIWINIWICKIKTRIWTWIHKCYLSTIKICCNRLHKIKSKWVNITFQWKIKIQWINSSNWTEWWISKIKVTTTRWTTIICIIKVTKCSSQLAQEARTKTLVGTTTSLFISKCLRHQVDHLISSQTLHQVLKCQWIKWWIEIINLTEGENQSLVFKNHRWEMRVHTHVNRQPLLLFSWIIKDIFES